MAAFTKVQMTFLANVERHGKHDHPCSISSFMMQKVAARLERRGIIKIDGDHAIFTPTGREKYLDALTCKTAAANQARPKVYYDIEWSDEQLAAAGIDKTKLIKLVRSLQACSKLMIEMDLHVYGASGSGCLIHSSRPTHKGRGEADQGAVVARVGQNFDGGDW